MFASHRESVARLGGLPLWREVMMALEGRVILEHMLVRPVRKYSGGVAHWRGNACDEQPVAWDVKNSHRERAPRRCAGCP